MNREELILSCQDTVKNLVLRYNNHCSNEDLEQTGMVGVIECINWCIENNISDLDYIKARANLSARNHILNEIYSQKFKITDEDIEIEELSEENKMNEFIIELEDEMTAKECEVLELLLQGKEPEEIMKKANIGRAMYFRYLKRIKNKIKNQNRLL